MLTSTSINRCDMRQTANGTIFFLVLSVVSAQQHKVCLGKLLNNKLLLQCNKNIYKYICFYNTIEWESKSRKWASMATLNVLLLSTFLFLFSFYVFIYSLVVVILTILRSFCCCPLHPSIELRTNFRFEIVVQSRNKMSICIISILCFARVWFCFCSTLLAWRSTI